MDEEVGHIATAINVRDIRGMGLLNSLFGQSSNDILEIMGIYRSQCWQCLQTLTHYEHPRLAREALNQGENENLRNDQVFCLDDLFCKKNLLAVWNTRSPSMAAMRLYCGVRALRIPVSKGEPLVMSPGYKVKSLSMSDFGALGRN